MTDEQIVKALERCGNIGLCKDCPYYHFDSKRGLGCHNNLMLDALDLIQRQQAEIDRLKDKLYGYEKTKYDILFQFERKVRKELYLLSPLQFLNPLQEAMPITEVALLVEDLLHNVCAEVIDNIIQKEIVEEMTEEEK